jgi:transposase
VILLPRSVRIYVATSPINLHRSFEGLSNEVRTVLAGDPLSGHLFLFLNRRATQVKILMWTRGGFTIVHKRLERGRFAFASGVEPGVARVEIGAHELSALLEGLELSRAPSARRWGPMQSTSAMK